MQDVHFREVSLYLSRLLFHVTGDLRCHPDLSYPPLSSTTTTSLLLSFSPSFPYFNTVSEATIGILTFTIQHLYYLRDAMPCLMSPNTSYASYQGGRGYPRDSKKSKIMSLLTCLAQVVSLNLSVKRSRGVFCKLSARIKLDTTHY